ncbi:MAG: hypothetical protein M1438_08280 [Deltaproteobacteria bacterium]|nr:hypothetical protein [Deltaproteobacteria bacterium]
MSSSLPLGGRWKSNGRNRQGAARAITRPGSQASRGLQLTGRHAWSEARFITREQDLGLPGLRMAKISYHPHRLVEKFRIQLA